MLTSIDETLKYQKDRYTRLGAYRRDTGDESL